MLNTARYRTNYVYVLSNTQHSATYLQQGATHYSERKPNGVITWVTHNQNKSIRGPAR